MIGLGRLAWGIENIVDSVPRRADRHIEQTPGGAYKADIKFEFSLYEYCSTTPSGLMKSIRRGFSPVSWRAASASGLAGLLIGINFAGPVGGLAGLAVGTYLGSQIKNSSEYKGRMKFEIESPMPREKLKYYAALARQNKFGLPWLAYAAKYAANVIAPKVVYSLKLAASKIPRLGAAAPALPITASPAMPAVVRPAVPETYKRTISMAYSSSENKIIVRYKTTDDVPKNILEWDTYSIVAAAGNRRKLDNFADWLANVPRRIKEFAAKPITT